WPGGSHSSARPPASNRSVSCCWPRTVASESTTSRGSPAAVQRHWSGSPFAVTVVTGTNRSPLPVPPASSQSVSPATRARYASALAPPRTAPRYHSPAAIVARRLSSRCDRSEEHTSELQSHLNLVCRLLLE